MGLHPIVRWNDAAMRSIEADAVHVQFIVDENIVRVSWVINYKLFPGESFYLCRLYGFEQA